MKFVHWHIVLIALLLTLKRFYTLFLCFYCLIWTRKYWLGVHLMFWRLQCLLLIDCRISSSVKYFTRSYKFLFFFHRVNGMYHYQKWKLLEKMRCSVSWKQANPNVCFRVFFPSIFVFTLECSNIKNKHFLMFGKVTTILYQSQARNSLSSGNE